MCFSRYLQGSSSHCKSAAELGIGRGAWLFPSGLTDKHSLQSDLCSQDLDVILPPWGSCLLSEPISLMEQEYPCLAFPPFSFPSLLTEQGRDGVFSTEGLCSPSHTPWSWRSSCCLHKTGTKCRTSLACYKIQYIELCQLHSINFAQAAHAVDIVLCSLKSTIFTSQSAKWRTQGWLGYPSPEPLPGLTHGQGCRKGPVCTFPAYSKAAFALCSQQHTETQRFLCKVWIKLKHKTAWQSWKKPGI